MLRTLALLVVTVCCALLIGSDALGRSMGDRLPQLAANLPLANGFDRSDAANLILAKGLGGGLFGKVDLPPREVARVRTLSRDGYREEPLNNEAVRNLALIVASKGAHAEATKLMRIAVSLSKRDLATNIWLAGDYARSGDIDTALAMYDQGLRSSARGQELIIPAMVQRLEDPSLVEPLTRLLAKRPPWALDFWAFAPRVVAAHDNLARIRLVLADRDIPVSPNLDRELVAALASSGRIAAAAKLATKLAPEKRELGDVVRNAEFERPPDFLPFDFQTLFDASLTSDLDDRAGNLRISVFGGGSGPAARQLIALPAQRYHLVVEADQWDPAQSGLIYVKLSCAEPGRRGETLPLRLEAAALSVSITKPVANCTFHWLTIFAAPSSRVGPSSVTLDRVSLIPVRG